MANFFLKVCGGKVELRRGKVGILIKTWTGKIDIEEFNKLTNASDTSETKGNDGQPTLL